MTSGTDTRLHDSFRLTSRIAAAASVVVGVIVLAGWALGISFFKSLSPNLASMKANTALAFVLAGAALWLLQPGSEGAARARRRAWALVLAALVTLIGALTLGEYLPGWNLGIDQLLFKDDPGAIGVFSPGRMAPNTAISLVLVGCALLLLDSETIRGHRPAEFFAVIAGFISLLALIGYAYDIQSLFQFTPYSSMALHTVLTFIVLAVGILCARPERGLMAVISSDSAGGLMARYLLPAAVVVPPFLGWLRLLGQRAGLYDTEFGLALFATLNVIVFMFLVRSTSLSLHRTDNKRREAEEDLRRLNLELEQRVEERTAQLESANKELESFSYSVSHDLRAPLRSMDGFSQILAQDYAGALDDQGRDHLKRVRSASQRMGQLIDDLLRLSRIARSEMTYAEADLSAMAQEIAGELRRAEPERNVEFDIAPGIRVRGDRSLLHVALENLLGNAWKFTSRRDPARIEFGAVNHDGATAYFVRDSGVGFDMAYADKLFGAFQRLHSHSEYPGTGIGLATVQRVIHRHGGRVWAEGVVDKGAIFYFTL